MYTIISLYLLFVFIHTYMSAEQLNACTVHLINDGITVVISNVTVEFAGTGPATAFFCSVDRGANFPCKCGFNFFYKLLFKFYL